MDPNSLSKIEIKVVWRVFLGKKHDGPLPGLWGPWSGYPPWIRQWVSGGYFDWPGGSGELFYDGMKPGLHMPSRVLFCR